MNRIKYYRGLKDLSCEQVARKIGCSNSLVTGIELNNVRSYPKIRKAISEALDVPESEIFNAEGWVRQDEVTESAE